VGSSTFCFWVTQLPLSNKYPFGKLQFWQGIWVRTALPCCVGAIGDSLPLVWSFVWSVSRSSSLFKHFLWILQTEICYIIPLCRPCATLEIAMLVLYEVVRAIILCTPRKQMSSWSCFSDGVVILSVHLSTRCCLKSFFLVYYSTEMHFSLAPYIPLWPIICISLCNYSIIYCYQKSSIEIC